MNIDLRNDSNCVSLSTLNAGKTFFVGNSNVNVLYEVCFADDDDTDFHELDVACLVMRVNDGLLCSMDPETMIRVVKFKVVRDRS